MRKPRCARSRGWGAISWSASPPAKFPKLPLNLVLLKGCDVLGVFWGSWIERDPAGHRANTEQLLAWGAQGKLSSHVHAVYPLAEAPAALKAIAARQGDGQSRFLQACKRQPAKFIHRFGELDVQSGHAAGVVGRQRHLDRLVDVEPFRMVVHLFRHLRRPVMKAKAC